MTEKNYYEFEALSKHKIRLLNTAEFQQAHDIIKTGFKAYNSNKQTFIELVWGDISKQLLCLKYINLLFVQADYSILAVSALPV